jgi:hypothetical protein
MSTYIDGICASQNIDSSGEIVDIKGLDISSLSLDGTLNWEHHKDLPMQTVGKIKYAKKIYSLEDCSTDREKYYFKKCGVPYVYMIGELFDDYVESAKHVAGLFKYDKDNKDKNAVPVVGFSVEGAKLPNAKVGMVLTRSIARKCTITVLPCNKKAFGEIMPQKTSKKNDDINSLFKTEPVAEIEMLKTEEYQYLLDKIQKYDPEKYAQLLGIKMNKREDGAVLGEAGVGSDGGLFNSESEKMEKAQPKLTVVPKINANGTIIGKTKSGKDVYSHGMVGKYSGWSHQDHQDAATLHHEESKKAKTPESGKHHHEKFRLHAGASNTLRDKKERTTNVKPMKKALDAGSGLAAPEQLSGGAALVKEDLEKKKILLERAEVEYDKWDKKEQFKEFMKSQHPEMIEAEIDSIGKALILKKSLSAEESLEKLITFYAKIEK